MAAVTKELFRKAWGKFATGVAVITTTEGGQLHGMTANAVCSVSLDPMLVLLCVGRERNTHLLVQQRGRFGINILSHRQEAVAAYFARDSRDRLSEVQPSYHLTPTGTAVIEGSLAFMDCRVVDTHEAGDHSIVVAQVDDVEVSEGQPLLFYEGRYRHLGNP